MSKNTLLQAASLVSVVALAGFALPAAADDNPFAQSGSSRILLAEAGGKTKGIGVLKGKCGEGKCGSQRVRKMMDKDGDGQIDRKEYIAWSTAQAESEFDKIAGEGGESATADDVFQNFFDWESTSDF